MPKGASDAQRELAAGGTVEFRQLHDSSRLDGQVRMLRHSDLTVLIAAKSYLYGAALTGISGAEGGVHTGMIRRNQKRVSK
jgi:hypothetical protein